MSLVYIFVGCALFFVTVVHAQGSQCPSGENVTFILLTSHKLDRITPLSSVLTFNLSSCIDGCIDDPRCHSVNIQDSPKNEFCSYYPHNANIDSVNETNRNQDLEIYYLEKSCLRGSCSRLFAFELVTGKELVKAPDTVIRNTTEKICLESCLLTINPPCLSASYDTPTGDCALRSASRFTHPGDFKDTDRKIRYFDNNCRDELPVNATYEIVEKNIATHFSDTDYVDISLTDCLHLCQNNPDYPCRAFFFGMTVLGRFCGLMHLTANEVKRISGGTFPADGVNLYEPAKKPKECALDDVNFLLLSGQGILQEPMAISSLSSPSICLEQCRKNVRCVAVSIDYSNATCNYYSFYKTSTVISDGMSSIYKKTCIDSTVKCSRDWAFERIEGQTLLTADKTVETFTSQQCMMACLEERRFVCKSFDYNNNTNRCRMSRLDRNSMNLKLVDRRDFIVPTFQSEIAYYENNCQREPSQFCFFEPVKGVDISSYDALVVEGIYSEEDCKRACQLQTGFNCRRYAFVSNSLCMLTHYTKTTAPPGAVLRHDSDSLYGEVMACYNVSVECGAVMTAHVQSNREYDGIIYAKGKSEVSECGQTVKQQFQFDLSLPLAMRSVEACNTVYDDEGEFRNAIVLQHNARVVTALDQTFGLECKYDLHAKEEITQTLNVNLSLNALQEATKETIRHRVKLPLISMKVLGLDGGEISQAELGSELVVRIEMEDSEDVFGLSIRNMFATDGRRKNNMTLVDMQGCPAENLIRNFRQINIKTLEARMEVFAFPDDSRIVIEAEVETCRHRCKPVICLNGAESYGRRRRDVSEEEGQDALVRNTLRREFSITSQKFTLPLTSDKTIRISVSGIRSIDVDGAVCFLPHILAILTVFWFLAEMTAVSTVCFLKKRINYFQDKVRNAEGFYAYGPYVTYATVPRKVAAVPVPTETDGRGSSAC